MSKSQRRNRVFASIVIILAASGLTYAPIPGMETTITIVSGTELTEPLQQLETKFEQANPNIKLTLKFQGSQEMVNKYLNDQNDFEPTILIPANGIILTELSDRFRATNNSEPFSQSPQPIVKTMLVGIAWLERSQVLFPDGRWSWKRLEAAMQAGNWSKIGTKNDWGSFDFVFTDPTRSNSGQMTLELWAQSRSGNLNNINLNNPTTETLFSLIKRSVYQPPRSTDILLQEFIAKGPNDADVATVYESIALHRSPQSRTNQGEPYQIFYLDPTYETTATAAILRRDVNTKEVKAAQKFLDFLTQPEQQAVFVQYGFRPVNNSVELKSVPNNPWNQNIPGAQIQPTVRTLPLPNASASAEIQRLWERAN
jgi:ABC-type molybdate transport system substrate-binding protein